MNEQIKLLLDYQELDKELKVINDSVMKTEEAVKYYQAGKFLQSVAENISALDKKAQSLISKYNAVTSKIKELNEIANEHVKALENCEDSEISYISKKYKERVQELTNAENELNAVIKEMEAVNKEYVRLGVENKKMRAQFTEFKPKFEELKASKKGESDAITKKQTALQKKIDEALFSRYEAKRKDKKFPIIYGVQINKNTANCSYCGNAFSVITVNDLAAGKLCDCDNCRSLIYALD